MKKIISILLTLCMLLAMFVVPATATEAADEVAYEDTTLGGYYKFTFGEDEVYNYVTNYTNSDSSVGAVTYKGNTFWPLWSVGSSASAVSVGHLNLETTDGKTRDVLEINNFANSVFTPLTKEGKPYELTPGKTYTIKIKGFIPRATNWTRMYLSLGNNDKATTGSITNTLTSKSNSVLYPYYSGNELHIVNGGFFAYAFENGTYDETTTLGACKCTNNEVCPGTSYHGRSTTKFYRDLTITYTVPEIFELDENNSYSATVADETDSSKSYKINNYLSLYLGGGKAAPNSDPNYAWYSSEGFDSSTKPAAAYQFESIEVYESGVGTVEFYDGDTVLKTEKGEAGKTAALYIPEIPAGKDYFVGWYSDADFTTFVTSDLTIKEGAPQKLYARFENYGTTATETFDTVLKNTNQYVAYNSTPTPYLGIESEYRIKTSVNVIGWGYQTKTFADGSDIPAGSAAFYTKTTWSQSGSVLMQNEDGTLFVPAPNSKYRVTVKYRIPMLASGGYVTFKAGYGTSTQKSSAYKENGVNAKDESGNTVYTYADAVTNNADVDFGRSAAAITENTVSTEWKTATFEVSTNALDSDKYFPSIGIRITNAGTTGDANTIELDSITVEKIPTATVTFVNGSSQTSTVYEVGQDITYPALTAAVNYDYVWSLNADSYVPVPKTAPDKNITVYAIKSNVLSFENFPTNIGYENGEMNTQISTKYAYTGQNSLRCFNYNISVQSTEPTTWADTYTNYYYYNAETDSFYNIPAASQAPAFSDQTVYYSRSAGSLEQGMQYIYLYDSNTATGSVKVKFKYLATDKNTTSSNFQLRLISYDNPWNAQNSGKVYTAADQLTVPAGATDGWQTAELYFSFTDACVWSGNCKAALDLKFLGSSTKCTNEIFVDDVEIEFDYTNTPTVVYHDGDKVINDTNVTAGAEYAIDRLGEGMDGKYFAGWSTTENGDDFVASVKMPAATSYCTVELYAVYKDYTDNAKVNYQNYGKPALKGVAFMNASNAYQTTLKEDGWATTSFNGEGIIVTKAATSGQASAFDPSKTDGLNGYGGNGYVTDKSFGETTHKIGEITSVGWNVSDTFILRDANGNAVMAKPGTTYTAVVTYKVNQPGSANIGFGAGRKEGFYDAEYGDKGTGSYYSAFEGGTVATATSTVTGEYETVTFTIKTPANFGTAVPVLSIHVGVTGFTAKRVAEANGVSSYTYTTEAGASYTVYPYEVINAPEIAVKEIALIEVESGNTAVTYNYYEKGVGFSAVLKDAAPGTALESTKNVDKFWYSRKDGRVGGFTTYPDKAAVYYNADYYMVHDTEEYSGMPIFATDKGYTAPVTLNEGGKDIYALKFSSDVAVGYNDVQVLRLDDVQDGHTYKFTASFKADEMNTDLSLVLATAQDVNVWGNRNTAATIVMKSEAVTKGEWTTITYYFSVDPLGKVTDTEETGVDYNTNASSFSTLYLHFVQGAALNTVYVADIEVKDLGAVVATGGASILTDEAAQEAGSQAMRYYFSYETTNGSDIILDGETFQVKERGFIYRNGALAKDAQEAAFIVSTTGVKRTAKTEDFNSCWKYEDGKMTFSTYVTGFDIGDTTKKLQVKAYLLVKNAAGEEFYIYSDSINRTIAGVGAGTDGDINLGL